MSEHRRTVLLVLVGATCLPASGAAVAQSAWTDAMLGPVHAAADALEPEGLPVGLVLGLREGDGYATYYLTLEGEAGSARRVADHLVSPQADGWWHLDSVLYQPRELCDGGVCDISVSTVWAGRTAEMPAAARAALQPEELAGILDGTVMATHEQEATVTAVADGMVCWEYGSFRIQSTWAHPSTDWGTDCRWIGEGVVDGLQPVDARSVLDAEAVERVSDDLRAAYNRGESDMQEVLSAEELHELGELDLSALTYFMERSGGLWQGKVFATVPAFYAMTPRYALFVEASAGPAPASVTPDNRMPLDFAALEDALPGLVDVLVAPTADLVVLVGDGRIVGLDAARDAIAFDIAAPGEAVVMADWALGPHVDRWRTALDGLE